MVFTNTPLLHNLYVAVLKAIHSYRLSTPHFQIGIQSYSKIFIFTTKSTGFDAIPQHPGHTSIFFNQKLIAVGSIHLPLITLKMEHRVQAFRLRKTKKRGLFFSFKSITELASQTGVSDTTPSPARECKR